MTRESRVDQPVKAEPPSSLADGDDGRWPILELIHQLRGRRGQSETPRTSHVEYPGQEQGAIDQAKRKPKPGHSEIRCGSAFPTPLEYLHSARPVFCVLRRRQGVANRSLKKCLNLLLKLLATD